MFVTTHREGVSNEFLAGDHSVLPRLLLPVPVFDSVRQPSWGFLSVCRFQNRSFAFVRPHFHDKLGRFDTVFVRPTESLVTCLCFSTTAKLSSFSLLLAKWPPFHGEKTLSNNLNFYLCWCYGPRLSYFTCQIGILILDEVLKSHFGRESLEL